MKKGVIIGIVIVVLIIAVISAYYLFFNKSSDCQTDKDCSIITPYCVLKDRVVEDMVFPEWKCVSKNEGERIRQDIYNKCMNDQSISETSKNFLEWYVWWNKNLTFDEMDGFLSKDYGLKILEKGTSISMNYIKVEFPAENTQETICRLKMDSRVHEITRIII